MFIFILIYIIKKVQCNLLHSYTDTGKEILETQYTNLNYSKNIMFLKALSIKYPIRENTEIFCFISSVLIQLFGFVKMELWKGCLCCLTLCSDFDSISLILST